LTVEDITEDKYNHVINTMGINNIDTNDGLTTNDKKIIKGLGEENNWSGYMGKALGQKDGDLPAPAGMITNEIGALSDMGNISFNRPGEDMQIGGKGNNGWSTMYKEWSDDKRLEVPGYYSGDPNWPAPHTCLTNQCWIGTDAPPCFFRTYAENKYEAVQDNDGNIMTGAEGHPIPHKYSGAYIYPDKHGQFVNPILRQMGYIFPIQLRHHTSLNIGQYWHSDGTGFLNGAGTVDDLTDTHKLVSSLDTLYLPILSEVGYMSQFSWDERHAIRNGWGLRYAHGEEAGGVHGYPWDGDWWGLRYWGAAAWANPGHPFSTDETIHPMGVAAVRGRYNMDDPKIAFFYYGMGTEDGYIGYHVPELFNLPGASSIFGSEEDIYNEGRLSETEIFSRDDACPALGEGRDFRIRQFLYWQSDAGTACMYVKGNFADNASLEIHIPKDSLKKFYCNDNDKAKYTSTMPEGYFDPETDDYYYPSWDKKYFPEPSDGYGECQEIWNYGQAEDDGFTYMTDPELSGARKWTPEYLDQNIVADNMEFTIGVSGGDSH
jgi:hypothetical protein